MSRPTKRIFSGNVTGEVDRPEVDRPSGTTATGSAPDSLSTPERRPGTMLGVKRPEMAGPPRPAREAARSPVIPGVGPRCKPGAPDALERAEDPDVGGTQLLDGGLLDGGAGIAGTQLLDGGLLDEPTGDDPIVPLDSQKLTLEDVEPTPRASDEDIAGGDEETGASITGRHGTRELGAIDSPHETLGYDTALRCPACQTTYSGDLLFCPFDGQPLEEAVDWDPGEDPLLAQIVAERYVVEAVIAEGGMGTVYRVRHAKLGNAFAMKVLRRDLAEDEQVAARLIEEARATAAIGHANIVSVSDFGEIDADLLPELGELKLPYFVMEYVPGGSLTQVIRRDGKLSAERVAKIVVQLASALSAAHASGIVHRDLKPENILLTSDESGNEIAKILDFGVAKVMGSSKKTQVGMVFGTPHYMSPEQGQGQKVDHRTDVYALGVIMYECLTGSVPYSADTYVGVVSKHINEPPPPIDDSLLDMRLGPIVTRCMEKDPEARYQAMSDLAHELEQLLAQRMAARRSRTSMVMPDTDGLTASGGSVAPPERKLVWVWAAAAAIGIAFLLVLALGDHQTPHPAAEPSSSSPPSGASGASGAIDTATAATVPDPPAASSASEAASQAPSVQSAAVPPPRPPSHAPPPTRPVRPRPPTPRPASGEVVDPWG